MQNVYDCKIHQQDKGAGMKKIKCVHFAGMILTILVLFPMLTKGIMCNDELLLRLWAQKGLKTFFETTVLNENIQKGRILGTLGNMKFLALSLIHI